MVRYCCYLIRHGSKKIERFDFDSEIKAARFEASKICNGWTGIASPDLPRVIEVPGYEQLSLF